MRRLLVLLLLALAVASPASADPPLRLVKGTFRGAPYACVVVDPRRAPVDLACYGRRDDAWTPAYGSLAEVGRRARAALNGTFFSLKYQSRPASSSTTTAAASGSRASDARTATARWPW